MALPLEEKLQVGIMTIHRRTEPATEAWHPRVDELVELVELVDRSGFDSMWVGDHISFTISILDPLLQLAQVAVASRRLRLGTCVYLLPLRHPAPVAKQVATLDHLTEGRLVFGVGLGGEFPQEYEVCGIPLPERGARLTESIEVVRKLWSGEKVSHAGRFFSFNDVAMVPPPRQPGGPPIWCGGRSDAALRRAGRQADGWVSYVVTPEMYAEAMAKIATASEEAGRSLKTFGSGHLLFARVDDSYEKALDAATATLSTRYGMDFRKAAQRYAALGSAAEVAAKIEEFYDAGMREVIVDLVGPYEERNRLIERFAAEVLPLIASLRQG